MEQAVIVTRWLTSPYFSSFPSFLLGGVDTINKRQQMIVAINKHVLNPMCKSWKILKRSKQNKVRKWQHKTVTTTVAPA